MTDYVKLSIGELQELVDVLDDVLGEAEKALDKPNGTETVADPYRTDPREAEIKKLTKQLADALKERDRIIESRDNTCASYQRDIVDLKERHRREITALEGSSYVRAFGKLMMAMFTVLWFLVNIAGLALPIYLVLQLRMDIAWLWLLFAAVISWLLFYCHIIALMETKS